ncbi:MAG: amino acid ABC transporter substrate-binding protein, partial [Candidatus Dadabacteria bacterium]
MRVNFRAKVIIRIILAYILLAAPFPFAPDSAAETESDLVIPVMVGQTGAASVFGKNELDGYTLAVEEWNRKGGVNGRAVKLKVEDTRTDQKQIITSFQWFAMQGYPVILGPTWLDGFPAVIPLAQRKGVLLVTPSAAVEAFSENDRKWAVSFYHNSTIETQTLLNFLKSKGMHRIALIYEEEPFSEMMRKLILKQATLIADEGVQGGTADFYTLLNRLKHKRPDVLIVYVWNETSLSSLLKQIQIVIPSIQLATVHDGESWIKHPLFKPYIKKLIHTKFIVADSAFAQRFKKRFGYEPILTASNAYDAMNGVLSALQSGAATGRQIRDYLMSHELDTATFGKFKFTKDASVPSKVR